MVLQFSSVPWSPISPLFHILHFPTPSPLFFFHQLFWLFVFLKVFPFSRLSPFPKVSPFSLYPSFPTPLPCLFPVFCGLSHFLLWGVIPFLQALDTSDISDIFLCTPQTQHATSDIRHQTLYTYRWSRILYLAPLHGSLLVPVVHGRGVAWARLPRGGDEEESRRHDPQPDWARGQGAPLD